MINFSLGPVEINDDIKKIAGGQTPYFRTDSFSKIMIENEQMILEDLNAPNDSKAIFLTASGSGAMEAAVINTLSKKDKVLVVNGGSFGQRFADILRLHEIPFDEILIQGNTALDKNILSKYDNCGYTAFVINVHEASIGLLYDIEIVHEFCDRNGLFLIVDGISSFLADEFDMAKSGTDVYIIGSQKGLACQPGISIIALSPRAIERINGNEIRSLYFDLKDALLNQRRGQTPFTPAVSILLQINARLNQIKANGGVESEIEKTKKLAQYFRNKIKNYPFEITCTSLSNAVTPIHPINASAHNVAKRLECDYDIWVCPNGGDLKDIIFRVGHLGNLCFKDYDVLFAAFDDMQKKD